MMNTQKFHRGELAKLVGQINSPTMTITNTSRKEVIVNDTEKIIEYSYECTWVLGKNRKVERMTFDEICLKRVSYRTIRHKREGAK